MPKVEAKLRRLLAWFVAYFVVGSVIADVVTVRMLGRLPGSVTGGCGPVASAFGVALLSVLIEIVVLALFLWVFHALLRLRDWARVVLLVFAWLGVLSAFTSLLSLGSLGMLSRWLPEVDLRQLALVGLVTNALGLLIWSYVLATLQFDREVRAAFPGHEPAAQP